MLSTPETPIPSLKTYQFPEHIPAVSFDITLGEQFSDVDFDYNAFQNRAAEIGLSDAGVDSLSIRVTNDMPLTHFGFYDPDDNAIDVRPYPTQVEKSLSHELRHAVDQEDNMVGNDTRFKIGVAAYQGVNTMSMILVGSSLAWARGSKVGEYMTRQAVHTIMALGAISAWGYYFTPDEIRARKAEKIVTPPVFKFSKKKSKE